MPTLGRRRIVVLASFALAGGFAVAVASGAAGIGARLAHGRPAWLVVAAGLELISALGFVAAFQLVFGEWLSGWMSLRVGLAVRAATIVLPAGGLLAIGVGARALHRRGMPRAKAGCRAIAFLLITNAPNLIVLAIFGLALGAGLLDGPHAPALTLVPGAIASGAIGLTLLLPVLSHQRSHQRVARESPGIWRRVISLLATQLELGVIEARTLLSGRDWKLLGVLAYYAADNAVLWVTFKAFGHARPPIATLVMAYLIGSAAGSLPVPAGLGVVEGGMFGVLVLYGAPAICAGIAVLAYRAVSIGLPLALGGAAIFPLRQRARGASSAPAPSRSPDGTGPELEVGVIPYAR
jgi:uncharacterized membrane protein YbhN (UPF0104 family)